MVGLKRLDDYWENFRRVENQSQIIHKRFEETFREREKVFQVSENTAKIRDGFLGCYNHSPATAPKIRLMATMAPEFHICRMLDLSPQEEGDDVAHQQIARS